MGMEPLPWSLGDVTVDALWSYQENVEELKHRLLCTTLELESLRSSTKEEMKRHEDSINHLLQLVKITTQERDEARDQLQILLTYLQPEIPPTNQQTRVNSSVTESDSLSGTPNHQSYTSSPVESFIETVTSSDISSMNMADSSKPVHNTAVTSSTGFLFGNAKYDHASAIIERVAMMKPLPQKGKLLQAVMDSGPLLQTVMVAGPLPRWRNPPPSQPFQIPPMSVKVRDSLVVNPNQLGQSSANVSTEPGLYMTKRGIVLPSVNSYQSLTAKRQKTH
ncbi:uncharacterized protein [Typha latifolia]|uniref:uncharacterized protein n=1 Tax=Typha latifolia TaxID=4733 RepID=UPI003C305280